MLIQFSVGNFMSFKDIQTFSMLASAINEHEEDNVFSADGKMRLLKSAAIYGANASGKSNLIRALSFVKRFAVDSSTLSQSGEGIPVEKFKLSSETEGEPCLFELIFIYEKVKYRYGFQVNDKRVYREWLYFSPKGQEAKLFEREEQVISLGGSFKEGKGLEEKVRENAAFLSVVAQFNGPVSLKILDWFRGFNIISGLNDVEYGAFARKKLADPKFKPSIMEFLKVADLGIEDAKLIEEIIPFDKLPKEMPDHVRQVFKDSKEILKSNINVAHKKFDKNNKFISFEEFELDASESEGTKKLFYISAPIIDTLNSGKILVIDEMDSRLHPALMKFIVKLFNSPKINKNKAQLIFASHDIGSLTRAMFRRDQIWFAEKDEYGATSLFSLLDYKVRKDASFDKDYLLGKYGAVPILTDPSDIFEEMSDG